MKLYLVQHGNQNPEEVDPEEGLSEKGQIDCEKVAEFAAKAGVKVSAIFHSVKLRAKQTAGIYAKHLNPQEGTVEKEGLKPMDDVTVWADQVASFGDELMLVGHLPFMQKLSALLLSGDQEKKVVNFHQGGIVCLEKDDEGVWSLQFDVIPELL